MPQLLGWWVVLRCTLHSIRWRCIRWQWLKTFKSTSHEPQWCICGINFSTLLVCPSQFLVPTNQAVVDCINWFLRVCGLSTVFPFRQMVSSRLVWREILDGIYFFLLSFSINSLLTCLRAQSYPTAAFVQQCQWGLVGGQLRRPPQGMFFLLLRGCSSARKMDRIGPLLTEHY